MKKENFDSTAELTSNPGFQSSLSITSKSDKPYNPFEHRALEHPNSTIGSIVHLLKACMGTGLLAMGAAFKNCGLLTGFIGTVVAGLVCTHTVHLLVRVSQNVCVDAKKPSLSFAETCGAAFTYGPKKLQAWGPTVKNFIDYSTLVTYISILIVYIVFIGSTLEEVFAAYLPEYEISIQKCCVMTLIPLVLLSQIRNLKYLVPFSLFANILILVVFGITFYYLFQGLPSPSEREMVVDVTQWPLFFSTVIFAIEGIGVVMPVENEMAHPEKFLGCPGVLNTSMTIVVFLYSVVGFFGYLKYGDDVRGSITLNLPQDEIFIAQLLGALTTKSKVIWLTMAGALISVPAVFVLLAQTAKLLMALVILFSYALQLYVPMEIITRLLKKRSSDSYNNIIQISIRTFIVICTIAIAVAFPNLELVISFVGAIFFSSLGILIPAVVHTVYNWDRGLGKFNYILYKNIILSAISIFALASGAYVSAIRMAEELYGVGSEESANSTLSGDIKVL